MESKSDKFKRVAENRTIKILHMIELLGNCSNKNVYDYDVKQVKKIFTAIENELAIQKRKFVSDNEKDKFKL